MKNAILSACSAIASVVFGGLTIIFAERAKNDIENEKLMRTLKAIKEDYDQKYGDLEEVQETQEEEVEDLR